MATKKIVGGGKPRSWEIAAVVVGACSAPHPGGKSRRYGRRRSRAEMTAVVVGV
jgi:hypothetical protein